MGIIIISTDDEDGNYNTVRLPLEQAYHVADLITAIKEGRLSGETDTFIVETPWPYLTVCKSDRWSS